jgi:hypothetical protein
MKSSPPSPEAFKAFQKLGLVFILTASLAFVVWEVQDFAASFAASEMTTQTTLRTMEERDDTRVLRAFQQARQRTRVQAELATESNPKQETRDAVLTVRAKTKSETLAGRAGMVHAMQAAFANEGAGELHDIGNAPYAKPVEDAAYLWVKQGCQWLAAAILLAGLARLAMQWRHSGLPRAALFGILASAFTMLLVGLGRESAPIWTLLVLIGLPMALITLVYVVTERVRRAAGWAEGRARITESKIEVEHHRFAGESTKLRNLPAVKYAFDVGTGPIEGERISLGFGTADNVDVVLKRYPVGAVVPVFYNPVNPEECVLERNPPASLGKIWGGTIFVIVAYELVLLSMWNVFSINAAMDAAFPNLHHPFVVIGAGLLGLFCLASAVWNMRHPHKAFPWLRTKGTVVSSATESYQDSSGSHRVTYYKPVIEFSYEVDGQEYHNIVGASGIVNISIAGDKAGADAEVARYPAGKELEVFYDPKNPTQSALNVDTEMMITGRSSLIVGIVLLAVAAYFALH